MSRTLTWAVAGASLLVPFAAALNPIEVQSQEFVDSATGKRFEIIGVDYQPGGEAGFDPTSNKDPLSDGDICLRDAALMQDLGINTIRTYNVDPYINHDQCLSIFNQIGIYVMIDVNSPLEGGSINRADPSSSYTVSYLNRTFAVIDAFRNYDNVIGFFSGNEIINDENTSREDPPYVRAVTRDLKRYIAARGGRSIPVGYSAADFRDVLVDTSNFLQCNISGETGVSSRSDFIALNSYSWCGADATFQSSTYNVLASDFAATTMPVFFSEYGCIVPKPRAFNEVDVLYGPLMTVWSGGLVYQWTEEGSAEGTGYGLIDVQSDGSVKLAQDYGTLQAKYAGLNYTLIESQNATARELVAPTCSSDIISQSYFSTDFDLPDPPSGTEDLINNGVVGAAVGSLVSVTKTSVNVVVTQFSGSVSTGLTISSVTSANRPASTSGGSGGTSPSASATTKPNAAVSAPVAGSSAPIWGFTIASFVLWVLS